MDNTINGRTPEEIKRGAHVCTSDVDPCTLCPYLIDLHSPIKCRQKQLMEDMYILIQQLEDGIRLLRAYNKGTLQKIVQLERERDAAVAVLSENRRCETCKYYTPGYFCVGCRRGDQWQWRGVQEVE